jgi:hypothetical protein
MTIDLIQEASMQPSSKNCVKLSALQMKKFGPADVRGISGPLSSSEALSLPDPPFGDFRGSELVSDFDFLTGADGLSAPPLSGPLENVLLWD